MYRPQRRLCHIATLRAGVTASAAFLFAKASNVKMGGGCMLVIC
jgi:hypothetical protein